MHTQFPPRGPRSNHIKIDVTTTQRKEWERLAAHYGVTVVEAVKTAMSHEIARVGIERGDPVPAVTRDAEDGVPEVISKMMRDVGATVTYMGKTKP